MVTVISNLVLVVSLMVGTAGFAVLLRTRQFLQKP
jgi:hypothetical protein